jgi:hypothetical protein
MAGVPKEHTDWMQRRFKGRTIRLVVDDYISEPSPIGDGLDQGDPQSIICYEFYNAPLSHIDSDSSVHIENYHMLAIGKTLEETTVAVADRVTRAGGVNEWATEHNTEFRAAKDQMLHISQRHILQVRPFRQQAKWVPEKRPNLDIAGYTVKPSMKTLPSRNKVQRQ